MTGPAAGLASLVVAATVVLGGCSATAPERRYDPDAAERLQSIVHAATSAAHDGAYTDAVAELDRLEATATGAYSRGEIAEAHFEAIMIAVALVRADLESALAASAGQPSEAIVVDPPSSTTEGTASDGTVIDGTTTEPGSGRGSPGEPGRPDDRGKRD